MLSKVIIFLAIISVFTTKNTQKKNVKRINRNNKAFANSKKNVVKHLSNMKNHYKRIAKLHNHIKKHGRNISHKRYNKLVSKYGKLIKTYNKNRKSVCAKLPPLWALRNKHKSELTPLERKCKVWYHQGQILGGNIANAFYKISFYRYYGSWLTKRLRCIKHMLNYKKKGFKVTRYMQHARNCYNKGYHYQMRRTFIGLHQKKYKLLRIRHPFRSYRRKRRAIKKAIRKMKRSIKK